jgi:hypothetical protein
MTKQQTVTTPRVATRTKKASFHHLVEGARPTNGPRLYAHTHAALQFLGLLDGKSALRKAAELILGPRAVEYHIGQANLVATQHRLQLTAQGLASFTARAETGKVDEALAKAFFAAFARGKESVAYSIHAHHLVPAKDVRIH